MAKPFDTPQQYEDWLEATGRPREGVCLRRCKHCGHYADMPLGTKVCLGCEATRLASGIGPAALAPKSSRRSVAGEAIGVVLMVLLAYVCMVLWLAL